MWPGLYRPTTHQQLALNHSLDLVLHLHISRSFSWALWLPIHLPNKEYINIPINAHPSKLPCMLHSTCYYVVGMVIHICYCICGYMMDVITHTTEMMGVLMHTDRAIIWWMWSHTTEMISVIVQTACAVIWWVWSCIHYGLLYDGCAHAHRACYYMMGVLIHTDSAIIWWTWSPTTEMISVIVQTACAVIWWVQSYIHYGVLYDGCAYAHRACYYTMGELMHTERAIIWWVSSCTQSVLLYDGCAHAHRACYYTMGELMHTERAIIWWVSSCTQSVLLYDGCAHASRACYYMMGELMHT